MRYRHILVTGGAGFVGSSLAISFKRAHPELSITVIDNLKRRGSELNINRLKEHGIVFLHGDIRTPEDLVFKKRIDLLFECSAEPSVLAGYGDNPAYIINTNLTGTINCLEVARRNRADIVFLSTSRVYPYGAINGIKTVEGATRLEWRAGQKIPGWSKKGITTSFTTEGPKTLYGATKIACEHIVQEYLAMYGLKGVINRCGVIAGPWQFGKVDQGVFTLWMLAHYFKRPLRYIGFGGTGKQVRDLLHVDDLCRLVQQQVAMLGKISGGIFTVGGGRECSLSLLEATHLCEKITGNRLGIRAEKRARPGDIAVFLSDTAAVRRTVGWQRCYSAEQTLSAIFSWIRANETILSRLI